MRGLRRRLGSSKRQRSGAVVAPETGLALTDDAGAAENTVASEVEGPGEPSRHPLVGAVARRDRFTFQDLVVEATTGIGARPARLVMTTLGTVLGIASLVVTVGFAQTAARQIASQFDAVAATQIVITPGDTQTRSGERVATATLPWDAPERVARLAGVEAAGLVGAVDVGELSITAVPVNDPSAAAVTSVPLIAATGGLLDAVRGTVVTGRLFDDGHDQRADRVAVLGARAADRLGIARIDRQPSIFIGDTAYAVIGIVDDMQRRPDLKDAVIIPISSAREDFEFTAPEELQVQIAPGAGPQIAEQAPIALAPDGPGEFSVIAPASGSDLSADVQADVNVVFLMLGAIALLAGGLAIANVTMLSVMERVGEIGLRRALGARRRQIAGQFMVESVVIGLLGGLIGSSLGVLAVVSVSLLQGWTPVIDPWIAVGAAVLGAVVGLAAGGLPARRAARIEPITALRGS